MHIGLIIEHERLRRERRMLQRIVTGLMESGAQVTAVLPEIRITSDEEPDSTLDGALELRTRMRVQPWLRRLRARTLADAMGPNPPDVLYAIGDRAWTVALDLGRIIDRPVTLDVWSAEQAARVPAGRARTRIAACIAATESIAEALHRRIERELVVCVPMGVNPPPQPRRVLQDPDGVVMLAVIGSGVDPVGHRAMLSGLSRLTTERPGLQACLELRGPYEHDIWRHARRLDLLGHISTIVDAAMHRPLLTGCDMLVVPERLGQMRSIILQAMAQGMPIVAADDPWLDMLDDDRSALIVDQADADAWTEALRRLLTERELVDRLTASARELVLLEHKPEVQLERLESAFRQIVSGGAHAFSAH